MANEMSFRKNRLVQSLSRGLLVVMAATVGLVAGTGCQSTSIGTVERITVEGIITVRGNVPFTEIVLETAGHNYYVLEVSEDQRAELMTPAKAVIDGRVFLGEWNGSPFAHLEDLSWRFIRE